MTFFERQAKARRVTAMLVLTMLGAVCAIVLVLNAVAFWALRLGDPESLLTLQQYLAGPLPQLVTLATLVPIVLGTLWTVLRLRGGGRAVAEMVGASPISRDSDNEKLRRLVNVVDEMSIASGTPVPELYVLEGEHGINAFVAGTRPTEAVLVVTRGALDTLDRAELQGVVGHEYSHILNGDMRLNIRLMGVLAGILLIGQIGRFLLRSSTGHRHRRNGDNKGMVYVLLAGTSLIVVGYIGVFFASLIKAAVSRQREFLADASAVQFTRNPEGLAGALWKIRWGDEGSHLGSSHADDLSHLCFGESVGAALGGLLSTHPPLDARIEAIKPGFIPERRRQEPEPQADAPSAAAPEAAGAAVLGGVVGAAVLGGAAIGAEAIADSVGTVAPEHMVFAASLLRRLPPEVGAALHSAAGARCGVYALLLSSSGETVEDAAAALIDSAEGDGASAQVGAFLAALAGLGAQVRLPLLNLALPALKQGSRAQQDAMLNTARALAALDRRISIHEFSLLTILERHLDPRAQREVPVKHHSFHAVRDSLALLLTLLARVGAGRNGDLAAAFAAGMGELIPAAASQPADLARCSLDAVRGALDELNRLAPLRKGELIDACARCVMHDGEVQAAEAELLQAVAECLDCPMPPVVVKAVAL